MYATEFASIAEIIEETVPFRALKELINIDDDIAITLVAGLAYGFIIKGEISKGDILSAIDEVVGTMNELSDDDVEVLLRGEKLEIAVHLENEYEGIQVVMGPKSGEALFVRVNYYDDEWGVNYTGHVIYDRETGKMFFVFCD